MNPFHRSNPRDARQASVTLGTILHVVALVVLASGMLTVFCSCKSKDAQQVTRIVSTVPLPSPAASDTIRTRAAATIKKVVLAHPALGPWAYRFATVCYQSSKFTLPTPAALKGWLAVAEIVAPDNIDQVLEAVVAIYAKDYQSAAVIQGVGAPYLLLLGLGIEDGVAQARAASTGEAP